MTGWGVERLRTAFSASTWDMSAGVSALMPPHSQGAERRTERRARRTGSRWGLRALVIGGLAGAAWLLTGTAAHAADRDPAPDGPGLIGSALHGDIAQPTFGQVLQAAAQPLESDRTAHRQHRASVLDGPVQALTRPVTALTHQERAGSTAALGGVDRVVRELTGPLRLTGGPADSSLAPGTVPLAKILRPVTNILPQAAKLPHAANSSSAANLSQSAEFPHVAPLPQAAEWPHATKLSDGDGMAQRPAVSGNATELNPVTSTGTAMRRHVSPDRVARTAVHRHTVLATVAEPETVRESTPGGDGPAPLQGHLGAISGISTGGSGAPPEGGSAAFLPAAVAAGSMALHRLPIATDVEVRRHDAEAPTVSPD
jgi:hypothetical protein